MGLDKAKEFLGQIGQKRGAGRSSLLNDRKAMKPDELFDAYGDALYRSLTLKRGSAHDAEDVLRKTFVRLARYGERRRLLQDPKAFVFRCVP